MATDRQQLNRKLKEEFDRWEALLSSLSEEQVSARVMPSDLSIKDVVAHLMAWQQRTIARLESALHNREPVLPPWPAPADPNADYDLEEVNAWIHRKYEDEPWPSVYRQWRGGYRKFMELSAAIPDEDMQAVGKFPWLAQWPVMAYIESSYEHHHDEHRRPLEEWLREHRSELDRRSEP